MRVVNSLLDKQMLAATDSYKAICCLAQSIPIDMGDSLHSV